MTALKKNPIQHRINWIKNDLKRVSLFLLIPSISLLVFPNYLYFLKDSFLFSRVNISWIIYISIFAFVVCFVVQVFSKLKPDYEQNIKAASIFSIYYFFVNAFSEELFFRGFLFSLFLVLTNSPIVTVLLSAFIFGYYHIPMFKWSYQRAFLAFLGGLLFGTAYFLTKSIYVVWIAHGIGGLALIHESLIGYFVWTKIRYKEITNAK